MEIVLVERYCVDAVFPESEIEVKLRGGFEDCDVRSSNRDDIELCALLRWDLLLPRIDPVGDSNACRSERDRRGVSTVVASPCSRSGDVDVGSLRYPNGSSAKSSLKISGLENRLDSEAREDCDGAVDILPESLEAAIPMCPPIL